MDNQISILTSQELIRQKNTLNLIASENYPSPRVLELMGSVWSNKYGEGYPGKRYYAGNQFTDELEMFVQEKALEVYSPKNKSFNIHQEYGVNVQVLSGSPANSTVYLSILNPGDTILSLDLASGGHLSHLHQTSNWNKFFKHVTYNIKEVAHNDFEIDLADFERKIQENLPKLVIIGFSSYTKQYAFDVMCAIAHKYGCLVLADIAHINGLVASGLHDSPFKAGIAGADFVSMTTHKTFRGPRGALLFAKKYIPEYAPIALNDSSKNPSLIGLINKTVFPGTSGGPHFQQIAAVGQACMEILGEDQYPDNVEFDLYSKIVLDTCKVLENTLKVGGLEIISPTENHLTLVKLPDNIDSLEAQTKLESIGVICNRNTLPNDTKTAWRPGGLRLGTAALASRGLNNVQATEVGNIIIDCLFDKNETATLCQRVKSLTYNLNWWY